MLNNFFTRNSNINVEDILLDIEKIKARKKLVIHHVSPHLVSDLVEITSSSLSLVNISAIASEEMEDIVNKSSSLILSLNNISSEWFQSAYLAVKTAKKKKKPVILELDKVNFSTFRLESARQIIESGIHIIKGKAEEINSLQFKIESLENNQPLNKNLFHSSFADAIHNAQKLSQKYKIIVIVNSEYDFLTNGTEKICILSKSKLTETLKNFDNLVSTMIAAFASVNNNFLKASAGAMGLLGVLTEILEEKFETNHNNIGYLFSQELAKIVPLIINEKLKFC